MTATLNETRATTAVVGYRITFDNGQVGRQAGVPPLVVAVGPTTPAHREELIAQAVRQAVVKHLASKFFDVSVDIESGRGYLEAGARTVGRFSITPL